MIRLQKLPKNVGDLGKPIVDKGFKKLPKVQIIAQSGYTLLELNFVCGSGPNDHEGQSESLN